jgi:hypothetical protein
MFHPFVDQIRSANNDSPNFANASEIEKFDYLSEIDFKFMNYAKNAVKSGERVIDHVFQPEIRSRIISIFGKSLYRTASPTHISILTEKILLIITDTGSGSANSNRRFGGIWLFIPLEKIHNGSIAEKGDGLVELSISLPEDEHIDTLFSESKKPELERLLKNIVGLKSGVTANPN